MARSVLIVEDDIDLRETLYLLFEASGLQVEAAGSVPDALACFERASIGLILTDDNLKGTLTGWDLAREVSESNKPVPVIAFTGSSNLNQLESSGLFAQVIEKPSDPDTLIEIITTHLKP